MTSIFFNGPVVLDAKMRKFIPSDRLLTKPPVVVAWDEAAQQFKESRAAVLALALDSRFSPNPESYFVVHNWVPDGRSSLKAGVFLPGKDMRRYLEEQKNQEGRFLPLAILGLERA